MPERVVDLRSDTVTVPTAEMYEAMMKAPLGDDVLEEDPTINRLEALAAEKLGKEAALFVCTGTMGNLIALVTHTRRGAEVIIEENSHIYWHEAAGMAVVGSLLPRRLPGKMGALSAAQVEEAIRPVDVHEPPTGLVCLENTHNHAGGTVISAAQIGAVAAVAHRHGLPLHIDGARIFNAAVAANTPVATLVKEADSVTFCLSKGLSCPAGSLLVGSKDFIRRARHVRKMLGGGMRQAGVLAAAGIVALETLVDRLADDHRNATRLALGIQATGKLSVDMPTVQTNMVYFELPEQGEEAAAFVARLTQAGVKSLPMAKRQIRLVTHRGIAADDIEYAIDVIAQAAAAL